MVPLVSKRYAGSSGDYGFKENVIGMNLPICLPSLPPCLPASLPPSLHLSFSPSSPLSLLPSVSPLVFMIIEA